MKTTLKIAALGAVMTCAGALAQQPPAEPPAQEPPETQSPATMPPAQAPAETPATTTRAQLPDFKTVDKNADGSVSKTEAASIPVLIQVWADADGDQDGSLSSAEYNAVVAAYEEANR
jgi:hypothetical protein